jgi:NAD(P)-dependent dehydrogenase (short-subunit alcohol dehydrogenase family)
MTISIDLSHQHIVITGAARGIGAAIAHLLASADAGLTLMGRNKEALHAIACELPGNGRKFVQSVDITDMQQVKKGFSESTKAIGPIHALVNNAGQAQSSSIDQTSSDLWNQMLAVNLTGTFNCIHAAIPSLRTTGSILNPARIINIASTSGLQGYSHVSAYTAAKHGVVGLTRALALELARNHITVNAVCPGYTETAIAAQAIEDIVRNTDKTPQQAFNLLTRRNPQQRMIRPEEVAACVLWLCQAESRSINGQAIAIDGGESAG